MNMINRYKEILILSFFSLAVYAQEQNSDDQNNSNGSETIEKPAESVTVTKKSSKNKTKSQVFKPSEEISEDVPVAFPVDI